MGFTRCFNKSDSLPLYILPSQVELEVPGPGETFFADPDGVEVTVLAAFLSVLPLVPFLTILPLEIVLVS